MTYKYYKQKKQIAVFTSVIEETIKYDDNNKDNEINKVLDIEGDIYDINNNNTIIVENTSTILLNAGESSTF